MIKSDSETVDVAGKLAESFELFVRPIERGTQAGELAHTAGVAGIAPFGPALGSSPGLS